ncbi:low molecular weight phosphatase family protein [Alkalicaulis satelles]|uniref:Low molecular weight phosphatase family protein n=2 Tax=Alkalicaulis satelles TaxID=2609175 RepID=A0A5M6ZKY1_9PROT|nr:low molecular weight phosphatase family protein [Alkalicaulis satelles]
MAERLWRRRFGPRALVMSCGVEPAPWPDGFMIAVMDELGEDLSTFECRDMESTADAPVELVVCLAPEAAEAASAFAERRGAAYEFWPVADPARVEGVRQARLDAYRATRDLIAERVARWRDAP